MKKKNRKTRERFQTADFQYPVTIRFDFKVIYYYKKYNILRYVTYDHLMYNRIRTCK